ncbi:hypothetical protein DDP54_09385 [Cellulomonas sp. WB94]|uniref:DUF937 domain-containing protein n=1 Tax=Cellulomonas sp. WB94 TaxID=2173174 RepID=UPI000D56C80D|nr:DUF937 domain-containing protein [Cellulomonas sp. WB94]PVU83173.1 hypothetical protein DDP54_09385 [Cellulomonas sp. WB94]
MTSIDELLAQVPLDQLAAKLGVDEATARQAVTAALPALVGGLHANAQDPAGAASLASALGSKDTSLVDGGVDLDQVDVADGEKIVRNVFGDNTPAVMHQLGSTGSGASPSIISKVLPMIAPIVLAYLAKQLTSRAQGGGTATAGPTDAAAAPSGGLGDVLGGILGSLGGGGATGGLLDGILGGLLGGGKR